MELAHVTAQESVVFEVVLSITVFVSVLVGFWIRGWAPRGRRPR